MNILFVCHGNICRSVMAEMIFNNLNKNESLKCDSAATSSEEEGNTIYPHAMFKLIEHNIKIGEHFARQMSIKDYNKFDLIIGMDSENVFNIMNIIKEDNDNKVKMLSDYNPSIGEIDDPWYTRDFEKAYNQIYIGVSSLLDSLGGK